jgi:uncharacterized protein (DUF1015 family)
MVDLQAFRGLRFNHSRVGDFADVLCPPYDVISEAERDELVRRSTYNVVQVELPERASDDPYAEAARALEHLTTEKALVRDARPSLYMYEVTFRIGAEERTRRSLVAAVRLTPWNTGDVLPHERTMAGPKEDRLRLLRATNANVSPVWTLYRGRSSGLERAWVAAEARQPELACRMADETHHRLWVLSDPAEIEVILAEFRALRLVIADGHHRYETALRHRDELEAAGRLQPGDPASFVLAHLVAEDDPGLVILPLHRVVRDLGPLDQVELEAELGADWHGEYYPIWETAPPEQVKALLEQLYNSAATERVVGLFGPDTSIFGILILRNKQLMDERALDRSEAWRGLDVALLDEGLIKPLLRQAGAEREQAIRYERDPYAALQAVLRGEYQIALFLNPTRAEQVISVAEAGDRMPEKSTYFYPKLPTGLVLRPLDDPRG